MRPVVSDTPYKHIYIMDDGQAAIGGTRIKIENVVLCDAPDMDAKRIKAEIYPFLTMGQIHSALAYYYDNKELVDRQIQEGKEYVEKVRAELGPRQAAFEKRLLKWRAERAKAAEAVVESR